MLFKIETNKKFLLKNVNTKTKIKLGKILNKYYSIKKIKKIYFLQKNSKTSIIYQINEINNQKKILRISNISTYNKLNRTLKNINKLNKNFFFEVVQTNKKKNLQLDNNNTYVLYKKLFGKIYNGSLSDFYKVLKKAIELHFQFPREKKLIKKKYKFRNCKIFFSDMWNYKKIKLKKKTLNILNQNIEFILHTLEKFENNTYTLDIQVVHSDMNHSNIILNKSNVTFLDIEDIRKDCLNVAISFLVFKLIRHSIYKKKTKISKFKSTILNRIIKILKKNKINLNKNKIFELSFIRTLSDLELILTQIKKNNFEYEYDLEKKLLNLIELRYMFR